jgi:colanic acid biosynthesis glycosyl transferase WcaI
VKDIDTDLNVLVIGQYFPPNLGGSATRAYNVMKGLSLNGCRVIVVTAFPHYPDGKIPKEYRWKPFKVEWNGDIKVIRTFMPPIESRGLLKRIILIGFFAISSLFAFYQVEKIDAVWSSSWIPGIIYGKMKKKPLALNVDDLMLEDLIDLKLIKYDSMVFRIAKGIFRLCLGRGDMITPISQGYVDTLSREYLIDRSRIHTVRGGVDLNTFTPNAPQQKTNSKFSVLYTGAFSVAYDFDCVLNAAKTIEEKDRGVEFILQGMGECEYAIRSGIDELDLRNVKVINKVFSREEVAELLNQADVLILPLKDFGKPYLGMSSKLYEYQAVSKPIICCAEGQPAEYVKKTNSGIVVPPGDHEKLAEAVIYLKENPDEAKKMGKKGREYVKLNASIKAIGLELRKAFEEHLGRSDSPSANSKGFSG